MPSDLVPTTGRGITVAVFLALVVFVALATSGWLPLLLGAAVLAVVLGLLYVVGYRVVWKLKHGSLPSLRKRGGS